MMFRHIRLKNNKTTDMPLPSYCFISFYVCARTENHPIEYAIDGTNRWWQSPSIQNGMEYHYVTITLDLKQVETQTHTCEETVLTSYTLFPGGTENCVRKLSIFCSLSVPCLYFTTAWSYSA